MLQSNHYELLDKLRFGKDNDERREALKSLINIEYDAPFEDDDILKLLQDDDPVIQVYAIGAIGRLQMASGIPELRKRYVESSDPLILNELLTAFQAFESDDFLDIVLEKLRKLIKKPWIFQKRKSPTGTGDKAFILSQILIPSLIYIQDVGHPGVEKTVKLFLDHEDANVRWHALKVFDSLEIELKPETLKQLSESDPNPLVREQAAIQAAKSRSGTE